MPTGTPPSADALFYDTFDGAAGPSAGHVPDYNVAGDAAWVPGATQQSGTAWGDAPWDEVSTFPAVLTGSGGIVGADDFYPANPRVLYPGYASDPNAPHAQPPEVVLDRFVLTFDLTFDIDSSTPPGTDGMCVISIGRRASYTDPGDPGSPLDFTPYAEVNVRRFMSAYRLLLRSGSEVDDFGFDFDADTPYTCKLTVGPDECLLEGFGTTRSVTPPPGPASDTLPEESKPAFGPLSLLLTRHATISRVLVERVGGPDPEPPKTQFWTGLVNAYEVFVPAAPPDPGGGAEPPEDAIEVDTVPYETTLGALDGTPIWYRVTLGAGNWKFSTVASPDPDDYDTYLALFDSDGNVVGESEDAGGGLSSEIVETLPAGTYYLALSTFEGAAGPGFDLTAGDTDVPAGTILQIEAA
ncbi:hypothetical protein D3C87_1128710 [compost metagenome]